MAGKANTTRYNAKNSDMDLVTGSTGSELTVTARWDWDDYREFYYDLDELWGTMIGSGGGGEGPPPVEPACETANAVGGIQPPDNAKYYLPKNVDDKYLQGALKHLSSYAGSHSAAALLLEFGDMYTNPAHPHFIDFKDWGTAGGPTGSSSGGTSTYYSGAAQREITSSVFEPFGNWFYGFAGTWAGISVDVLYGAAAIVQEGNASFIPQDAPEDVPHVSAGILAAKAYRDSPTTVFSIQAKACASGVTNSIEVGGTTLAGQRDPDYAYQNPSYRAGLWQYIEDRYNEV